MSLISPTPNQTAAPSPDFVRSTAALAKALTEAGNDMADTIELRLWRIRINGAWVRAGSRYDGVFYSLSEARRAVLWSFRGKIDRLLWDHTRTAYTPTQSYTPSQRIDDKHAVCAKTRKLVDQMIHDGRIEFVQVYGQPEAK